MIDRRRVAETAASAATHVPTENDLRFSQVSDGLPDEKARPRRPTPVARVAVVRPAGRPASLRSMLSSPEALQQAIVLTEVLGRPKSLQRVD